MEPDLWELYEDGRGDDEVAAIIRLGRAQTLPHGVRVITQFGDIATIRLKRDDVPRIDGAVEVVGMAAGWTYLGPDVESGESESADSSLAAVRQEDRRASSWPATGRGVVLGVVDWGFDFAHPDFRKPTGESRILALWDQRGGNNGASPKPFGYGRVFDRAAIDHALGSAEPYRALSYHPADADTGRGAHGTHVASIAAGTGGEGRPLGVAPDAELVLVHSAPWDTGGRGKLGDSVTLLEAIDFISQVAGDRPWVINLSMGRHGEQHDGSTLVEVGLDAALRASPGRAICMSAGNYHDKHIHCADQLHPTEKRTFVWEINEGDVTENELEVWYSGRDRMEVEVRSPDRSITARARLGERVQLTVAGKEVGNIYHGVRDSRNLDNHVDVFLYKQAAPGPWEITLIASETVDGRFHAWIERDSACPRCQSRFRVADSDPRSTTGTICNGLRTIAVGAYDARDTARRLGSFSSRGPTRDGRLKPDLCAPGVSVLAARSSPRGAQTGSSGVTRMSGTSMAAPHVAGAVALMFEAAPRKLRIGETRNLLLQSTERVRVEDESQDRIGIGFLDVEAAIAAVRNLEKDVTIPKRAEAMDRKTDVTSDVVETLEAHSVPISNGDRPAEVHSEQPSAPETFALDCDTESIELGAEAAFGPAWVDWFESTMAEAPSRVSSARMLGGAIERALPALAPSIRREEGEALRGLFESLAKPRPKSARVSYDEIFEVVAPPQATWRDVPRAGDVLIRRGDDGDHHFAVLAGDLIPDSELALQGLRPEVGRPGLYAQVVEGGTFPHRRDDRFARRIAERTGVLEGDQMIVRLAPAMMLMAGAMMSRSSSAPTGISTTGQPEPGEWWDTEDGIPSSGLQWQNGTDDQVGFMRRVYDRHVTFSKARGGRFTPSLPKSELEDIDGDHEARKPAGSFGKQLLAKANAQLEAEKAALSPSALQAARIYVNSAYRSASRQFANWQKRFPDYYGRTNAERTRLSGGEHGDEAVDWMARYIGKWLAAPGYSLHNRGLAIDFGTQDKGVSLGASSSSRNLDAWRASWFFDWLSHNAASFHFHQNEKINEPWHWEFRGAVADHIATPPRPVARTDAPAASPVVQLPSIVISPFAIHGGREEIDEVPILQTHGGTKPHLVLRWNDMDPPSEVDLVVHLHGYSSRGADMRLVRDKEPFSGLDFHDPAHPEGVEMGRTRPTLALLPRGRFFGGRSGGGYDFPALVERNGLQNLIDFALARFAQRLGRSALSRGRLILTAHSGGGAALLKILQHVEPDEVVVFDGLYQNADALVHWARRRFSRDRAALEDGTGRDTHRYRDEQAGALRVFYRPETATEKHSLPVRQAVLEFVPHPPWISAILGGRFRVESTRVNHHEIPRRFGWRLLADAGTSVS